MTLRGFGEDDTPEEAAAREALERVLREHAAVFAPYIDEDGDCVDPTDDDAEDARPMSSPMLESYVLLTSWQSLDHADIGGVTFSCSHDPVAGRGDPDRVGRRSTRHRVLVTADDPAAELAALKIEHGRALSTIAHHDEQRRRWAAKMTALLRGIRPGDVVCSGCGDPLHFARMPRQPVWAWQHEDPERYCYPSEPKEAATA